MKNKKGFTIVELVIVIAVIAILAAVLIPTFTTVTANARASAALQQAKSSMESLLSNTQGQMSTGSLFAVTNQKSYEANYWFTFADGAIAAKTKKEMDAGDGLWPAAHAADEETDSKEYYRVFVTYKAFATAGEDGITEADITTAKAHSKTLLESVLKDCLNDGAAGTVAFGASMDVNLGYIPSTYTYRKTGADADTVVFLKVYTSGDLADTCVAIIK